MATLDERIGWLNAEIARLEGGFVGWLFSVARTEEGGFPDWGYVREYAESLAAGGDLVVLKRRQILVSWVTAAYVHYMASRNAYWHAAVVSAGKMASAKQGRRIVSVARADGYVVQGVDLIKYPNGSEVSILPSTEHAGVGETLRFVHFDEFGFHPYGKENMDTIRPAVSNAKGQIVVTSTSNPSMGESGAFYEMWVGSKEEQRRFYGRWVRPDQGGDFIEEEAAKPGQSAATMAAYYPESPDDAFVSHSGLVFGEDHDGVLLFHPQQNVGLSQWKWEESKWRLGSVDPGGTGAMSDPTGIVTWGVASDERCYQYGEKLWHGNPGSLEIGAWLLERHRVAPFDFITVDPSAPTTIVDLQKMGLPAIGANNDRTTGMAQLAWLFKSRRLVVSPDCEETLHHLRTYWHSERKDRSSRASNMVTVTPKDHHAELVDCNRYNAMRLMDGLPMGYESGRVPLVFRRSGSARFGS